MIAPLASRKTKFDEAFEGYVGIRAAEREPHAASMICPANGKKKSSRNCGAVIAGRVILHNASSAAAPGHLAARAQARVGCKNGAVAPVATSRRCLTSSGTREHEESGGALVFYFVVFVVTKLFACPTELHWRKCLDKFLAASL